jgi:hypothetical protein
MTYANIANMAATNTIVISSRFSMRSDFIFQRSYDRKAKQMSPVRPKYDIGQIRY